MNTADLFTDWMTLSELIADAVIKRVSPIEDDLSTREAQSRYGREWLNAMVSAGRVRGHRVGGKVLFSRHELDTLRAVERATAKQLIDNLKTQSK